MNYYWVVDYLTKDNGKIQPVILGNRAFTNEMEAQRFLDGITATRGVKIVELPTRNSAKASQYIRGKRVEETRNTSEALTRVKHQKVKGIEREEERPRFSRRRSGGSMKSFRRRREERGLGSEPREMRRVVVRR